MAKADSVYITPPTNTSAIDHPMMSPPSDPTRRRFLAVAAVASAVSAGTLAAATAMDPSGPAAVTISRHSTADPIFGAIQRHRDLVKPYDAAWEVRGRCRDFGTLTEEEKARVLKLNDAVDEAHLPLEAAAEDLCNTEPTTHAGIICAISYMRIQHRNNGEHMVQGWMEDEDGERYIDWRDAWLETLNQAIMQLGDAAVLS
jgi:hypothetical protein